LQLGLHVFEITQYNLDIMLNKLTIRNFKLFDHVDIELGDRVVLIGPNNSGKTSALQALALWSVGVRKWAEKRGPGEVPKDRSGVTINRKDLIAVPVPSAKLLWRDLHVREGYKDQEKSKTRNVMIQVEVEGIGADSTWNACLEFDYANEESVYCRPPLDASGVRRLVPPSAADVRVAYLPPMSGISSNETRLDEGAIAVRIGEGRTAEVLRNLCWQVSESSPALWDEIVERMRALFGVTMQTPKYIKERGEITMTFRTKVGIELDISASGRGQQQTLLLLTHMAANPRSVLLLDEPDAHLEFLRQRQIYQVLTDVATAASAQIIAASHSEVVLNEAADRDLVIAFIGLPHRIDDRGSQAMKALKEIGFEQYVQAEETGWVLYLEGATDLAILKSFADRLNHRAAAALGQVFVGYVGNQPQKAREHFYGLREAKPDLRGIALYDRLDKGLPNEPPLVEAMWRRREIENYICNRETLLSYAEESASEVSGELFRVSWRTAMEDAIEELTRALNALGKPDPWSFDVKASDDFLNPLFRNFYARLKLPNRMGKTDYHALARFVPITLLDAEISEKLDAISGVFDPPAKMMA
jgi:energy-coupling factor transporter ATP-binding protein EcfA2